MPFFVLAQVALNQQTKNAILGGLEKLFFQSYNEVFLAFTKSLNHEYKREHRRSRSAYGKRLTLNLIIFRGLNEHDLSQGSRISRNSSRSENSLSLPAGHTSANDFGYNREHCLVSTSSIRADKILL